MHELRELHESRGKIGSPLRKNSFLREINPPCPWVCVFVNKFSDYLENELTRLDRARLISSFRYLLWMILWGEECLPRTVKIINLGASHEYQCRPFSAARSRAGLSLVVLLKINCANEMEVFVGLQIALNLCDRVVIAPVGLRCL